jgi:hypothetical protein
MHARSIFPVAILLAGCQNAGPAPSAPLTVIDQTASHAKHTLSEEASAASLPKEQLAAARRATVRYLDVRNAVADGYHDIDVTLKNMGRHFLRDSLLDARFDLEHPELLVYSPGERGALTLVAVEYAIPLAASREAPSGFIGRADQWFADQTFHLWTLHAWIYKENPQGLFNPTNTRVP